KLLKDLKELSEYDQSISTDRPIFLNDNEDHPVQNKESPKNSSEETVVSKTNQEPPQDSDIHQLIEECCIKVPEQQKQKMEDTMFELNFRVVHKSSISFKDTSQISSFHSIAPIQSTKEPEHLLSMGDDESLPDEDVPTEEFKIYSNPLCDEDEINFDKLDPHCFNVESDFVESLLNRDTLIDFSSKFDFSGELAHIKP
nr:hypothetical protein [Tanacetum cinerariifolium]